MIPINDDPGRADELVRVLRLQGIEVARAKAAFTASRVTDIFGKVQRDRSFETGTWVVPLGQPLKRLAKTLLEPRAEIQELYFYDVSAWSLPLAYGVPCFEVDARRCQAAHAGPLQAGRERELENVAGRGALHDHLDRNLPARGRIFLTAEP